LQAEIVIATLLQEAATHIQHHQNGRATELAPTMLLLQL
jgi:hypothetical protein